MAEEPATDSYPSRWPVCEHDFATDVLCPDIDPLAEFDALMREAPGTSGPDHHLGLLGLPAGDTSSGLGYLIERRPTPVEHCRWHGCQKSLHGPGAARRNGRPQQYCTSHRKSRRARVKALERKGIRIGRHRNLTYDFPGNHGQDLDGYRELWAIQNLPRV
ncbi:hypothetical protein KSE_66140 [Kitasatospora setae KM-6054]|uniref:Uncharacterized protein n=2 Tax=Streptomycetaceae TaxID=2062 RepID=E4N2I9_KITSK|nr:hypothetical protein KSE_66140 [Kitasatospora setae KM-6054]